MYLESFLKSITDKSVIIVLHVFICSPLSPLFPLFLLFPAGGPPIIPNMNLVQLEVSLMLLLLVWTLGLWTRIMYIYSNSFIK